MTEVSYEDVCVGDVVAGVMGTPLPSMVDEQAVPREIPEGLVIQKIKVPFYDPYPTINSFVHILHITDEMGAKFLVRDGGMAHLNRPYPQGPVATPILHRGDKEGWLQRFAASAKVLTIPAVNLTSGMDPEVFAVRPNGMVIPAFEYLPDKKHPEVVHDYNGTEQANLFYDGFQAEFTIPGKSCHGFVTDNVRAGLKGVLQAARRVDGGAILTVDSVVHIPDELRGRVDPRHFALGCSPSRNAYGEVALDVEDPSALPIRFAGAHMHFGLRTLPKERVREVVKLLDAIAGVAMVAMGEGYHCPDRRQYYGRAGEYRYHKGVPNDFNPSLIPGGDRLEYRVPDTVLLAHPATFNAMWDVTRVVFRMAFNGMGFMWKAGESEVRNAINNYDVTLARTILSRNDRVLRLVLDRAHPGVEWGCPTDVWTLALHRLLFEGIGSVVANPRDIIGNWMLEHPTDRNNGPGWHPESYFRLHSQWPTGKLWTSAAQLVVKGGRV